MKATTTTLLLLWLSLYSICLAQPGTRDESFGNNGFTSIEIGQSTDNAHTVVALPDGKVIVVGNRMIDAFGNMINSVARSMPDGSPDISFGVKGAATVSYGTGSFVGGPGAVQPDGKVLVTGAYQFNPGDYDVVVARLNADGTLDASFGTGGKVRTTFGALNDFSTSIALQPDGKIVIGGYSQVDTLNLFALARFNADGTADNSFSGDGKVTTAVDQYDAVGSVAIQQDGKIVAGGTSSNGTESSIAIVRYNGDGSLDATFSDDGRATIDIDSSLMNLVHTATLPDGKLMLAGLTHRDLLDVSFLGRAKADGTLDSTFGHKGTVDLEPGMTIHSVHESIDGKTLVTGSKDDAEMFIARYRSDGTLDSSFAQDGVLTADPGPGYDRGSAIDIQANGNIVVAADISGQQARGFVLVQWTSTGDVDNSWGGDGRADLAAGQGNDYLYGTTVQSDGRILIAGTSYNGESDDLSVAGFTSSGDVDLSFGTMGFTTVNIDGGRMTMYGGSPLVQSDGKIIIGGEVIIGDVYKIALARLTKDGDLDATFGNGGTVATGLGNDDDGAYAIAIQPDGKSVITGYSLNDSSQYDGIVVRYRSDGSQDSAFGTDGIVRFAFGSQDYGEQIAVRPDGKIVVAARTSTVGSPDLVLLQLNPDGSFDKSFGTNGSTIDSLSSGDDGAYAMGLQADGKIVLGGFTHPGGTYDAIVLRYTADGKPDVGFGSSGKYIVAMDTAKDELIGSLAIQADGKILASGYSAQFIGSGLESSKPILLRLNSDGSVDGSFGTDGRVVSAFDHEYFGMGKLALQPDGNIIVAMPTILNDQIDFAPMRLQAGPSLSVGGTEIPRGDLCIYQNSLTEEWTVQYGTTAQENVSIVLIDMQGKVVATIQPPVNAEPGTQTAHFNASRLARGAYILRISGETGERYIKVMK